jgi:hypothetical protein
MSRRDKTQSLVIPCVRFTAGTRSSISRPMISSLFRSDVPRSRRRRPKSVHSGSLSAYEIVFPGDGGRRESISVRRRYLGHHHEAHLGEQYEVDMSPRSSSNSQRCPIICPATTLRYDLSAWHTGEPDASHKTDCCLWVDIMAPFVAEWG